MNALYDVRAGEIGDGRFNVHSESRDHRARLISNFANRPFIFNQQICSSVEGFIQGIKHDYDNPGRWRAFASSGIDAKLLAPPPDQPLVWWNGAQIKYGSSEHHAVIEQALRQKFIQNEDCAEALLSTGSLTLVHDTGEAESPHTSLPAVVFCDILTRLRVELIALNAR
jgi:hypothetical protein